MSDETERLVYAYGTMCRDADSTYPRVDHEAALLSHVCAIERERDTLRAENSGLKESVARLREALEVVIDDLMYKDHGRVIDVARVALAPTEDV